MITIDALILDISVVVIEILKVENDDFRPRRGFFCCHGGARLTKNSVCANHGRKLANIMFLFHVILVLKNPKQLKNQDLLKKFLLDFIVPFPSISVVYFLAKF